MVDKEQEEIRFALGAVDDHRRLIAAGKTQRWDIVKWAVTINMALPAASVALRQQGQGGSSRAFLALALFVFGLALLLGLEVNRRITVTRESVRAPETFLVKRGLAVYEITPPYAGKKVSFWYDWPELVIYFVILLFSLVPSLALLFFWDDLTKLIQS